MGAKKQTDISELQPILSWPYKSDLLGKKAVRGIEGLYTYNAAIKSVPGI